MNKGQDGTVQNGTVLESEGKLSPRQMRAIVEILASPSLEEARRRLRAGKDTIYRWMRDPTFQAEMRRQQEAMVEHAFDRLKAGMAQAVDKLMALMASDEDSGIQLRAAQTLLDHGIKIVEIQELESRLKILEGRFLEKNGGP